MSRVFDWMSALGDLTRVRMLAACEQRELSVGELVAVLQVPQSTASRHLKVLSGDGWLASRRDGTSRFYSLDKRQLPAEALKLWRLVRAQAAGEPVLRGDDARLARVLLERQSRSQAFFATSAEHWDRLRGELFGQRFDAHAFMALLGGDEVVGDLGCGTGQTAELLARFARKVHAVDASAAMVRAAHHRLRGISNVELQRAELEDLPMDDGALDVALLSLVLHHVAEPPVVLAEAARALAPGGRVVIVDMQEHQREEYRQQMGHVWLGFPGEQLSEWLRGAGLTDVRHVLLPPDPAVRGPALFVACARKSGPARAGQTQTRPHK